MAQSAGSSRTIGCINAGWTRTRMRAHVYPAEDPKTVPLPESLTGPYRYLLGPASAGVTGQRIECQPS